MQSLCSSIDVNAGQRGTDSASDIGNERKRAASRPGAFWSLGSANFALFSQTLYAPSYDHQHQHFSPPQLRQMFSLFFLPLALSFSLFPSIARSTEFFSFLCVYLLPSLSLMAYCVFLIHFWHIFTPFFQHRRVSHLLVYY